MQDREGSVDGVDARTHRRAESALPVFCNHNARRRGHVHHGGTQHHHNVVAPSGCQRGDAGAQPSAVLGKHFRHAVASSGAGGQQYAGHGDVVLHVNSVNHRSHPIAADRPYGLRAELGV